MTDDPSAMDDGSVAAAQSVDEGQSAPALDDDADGTLDAHEDLGQAGTEPDEGPTAPPPLPQP